MERMLSCSVMRMIAASDQTNGHCKQDNVYAIQRFYKPLRRDILVLFSFTLLDSRRFCRFVIIRRVFSLNITVIYCSQFPFDPVLIARGYVCKSLTVACFYAGHI